MENVKVTGNGEKGSVPARISLLFARSAPIAVILRRGPSKWVQIIKWNTETDLFEPGQSFHGKIYDRRSDLSPDGSLFLYFAQKINKRSLQDSEYTYAWTAVSKPPYLTALALWPKGDCWHGGGLFQDDSTIILNHKPNVAEPHPDHKPEKLRVILKEHVHGEDEPIYAPRLDRDGWSLKREWCVENRGYPLLYKTIEPEIREKPHPSKSQVIRLQRSIEGLDYSEDFSISSVDGATQTPIERASWVDWDQQGRLVFARDGKIFSALIRENNDLIERELLDLNPSKPNPKASPDWATRW